MHLEIPLDDKTDKYVYINFPSLIMTKVTTIVHNSMNEDFVAKLIILFSYVSDGCPAYSFKLTPSKMSSIMWPMFIILFCLK